MFLDRVLTTQYFHHEQEQCREEDRTLDIYNKTGYLVLTLSKILVYFNARSI